MSFPKAASRSRVASALAVTEKTEDKSDGEWFGIGKSEYLRELVHRRVVLSTFLAVCMVSYIASSLIRYWYTSREPIKQFDELVR